MTASLDSRARSFDLPPAARDWLQSGDRSWLWLSSDPSAGDVLAALRVLQSWDALAGRIMRESLLSDAPPQVGREARKTAEAVAAVAHSLAVFLGVAS